MARSKRGFLAFCIALFVPFGSFAVEPLKRWQSGDRIVAAELNDNFEALRDSINELETRLSEHEAPLDAVPPGTVAAFAGRPAVVPDGWLLCDGRGISRLDYPRLWAAIETAWGDGSVACEAACDFNVPDLRGRFLRGVDLGVARDPDATVRERAQAGGNEGDNVGSIQEDWFPAHQHEVSEGRLHNSTYCPGMFGYLPSGGCTPATFATSGVVAAEGETRPENAYVNYIIKY